jgi:hypothetical protein
VRDDKLRGPQKKTQRTFEKKVPEKETYFTLKTMPVQEFCLKVDYLIGESGLL